MAEQQPVNALAAAFPIPPPYYQHFTPENLSKLAALREEAPAQGSTQTSSHSSLQRILDLPPELRFLQPPEPPSDGRYRNFGGNYTLNESLPSLSEQGIPQVYTPPSTAPPSPTASSTAIPSTQQHTTRALILKRLAKSLLLNFLELIGIMSIAPEGFEEKISDVRTLFINFHHLLNEYRPHQARESLILMMEEQVERCRRETEGVKEVKARVESLLQGLGQAKLIEEGEGAVDEVMGEKPVDDVWEELEREFN